MEHGFEIAHWLFTAAALAVPPVAFKRPDIYELVERPYAVVLVAAFVFLGILAFISRGTPNAPPGYVFVYLGVLLFELGAIHDILVLLGKKRAGNKRDRV
jgi:hypothetical protein